MNRYFWVVVVVVLAAAAYYMRGNWSSQYSAPENGYQEGNTQNYGSGKTGYKAGSSSKSGGSSESSSTNPQAYTDVVKQYSDRRIQFDDNCQATPKDVTYKSGSYVMLDNRSASARTISVAGIKHSLSPYGYKIISVSSSTLPKELWVGCGASVNVGRIWLQAQISR